MSLTAEQKIRQQLSGNPLANPVFQHEGPLVVRWLTGGSAPDAFVTFTDRPEGIVVCCARCGRRLESFPKDYGEGTHQKLGAVRQMGHSSC